MLGVPFINSYGSEVDNWDATPGLTIGTNVTTGGSANTDGSWTQVLSALARDVHWMQIQGAGNQATGNQRDVLFDIGVDPAGGTSYTAVKSSLSISCASAITTGPAYCFPIYIPAGATVAIRSRCNAASITTRFAVKAWGDPSFPEMFPCGLYHELVGTVTGSAGVSFTPGNAAWGSWQSLGTIARPLWYWQLGVGCSNATMSTESDYVQLGYGDGTTGGTRGIAMHNISSSTAEAINHNTKSNLHFPENICHLPAGTGIYVRGWASAAPQSGWWALAYGTGGGR